MADVSYVLPDSIQDDPAGREALALRTGCDFVEVGPGVAAPEKLPWVLRAVPASVDGPALQRWRDRAWTAAFAAGAAAAVERVPAAVLIGPGDEWTGPADLARAVAAIRDGFLVRFGEAPSVLIANGEGDARDAGTELAEFWDHLRRRAPGLVAHSGIAVDAPALYAVTRSRMAAELELVPVEALRYVRVHSRGRRPDLGEPLPWRAVFDLVRRAPGTVMIAPAVRDREALEGAILFCMLSLQGRAFT